MDGGEAATQPLANHTPANQSPRVFTCAPFHFCTFAVYLVGPLSPRSLLPNNLLIRLALVLGRAFRPAFVTVGEAHIIDTE